MSWLGHHVLDGKIEREEGKGLALTLETDFFTVCSLQVYDDYKHQDSGRTFTRAQEIMYVQKSDYYINMIP